MERVTAGESCCEFLRLLMIHPIDVASCLWQAGQSFAETRTPWHFGGIRFRGGPRAHRRDPAALEPFQQGAEKAGRGIWCGSFVKQCTYRSV
jgi:hypothetical protein